MKIKHRVAIVILLICTIFAYAAKSSSDDAELIRRLIGTWMTDPTEQNPVVSTAIYNADGTGSESVRLRDQAENTSIVVTTSWSITNSMLKLKTITSSDPQRIPVGLEVTDRIISLSDDRFVYEAFEGYGASKGKQGVKVKKK